MNRRGGSLLLQSFFIFSDIFTHYLIVLEVKTTRSFVRMVTLWFSG